MTVRDYGHICCVCCHHQSRLLPLIRTTTLHSTFLRRSTASVSQLLALNNRLSPLPYHWAVSLLLLLPRSHQSSGNLLLYSVSLILHAVLVTQEHQWHHGACHSRDVQCFNYSKQVSCWPQMCGSSATPEETYLGPIGPQFIPPNIEPQLRFQDTRASHRLQDRRSCQQTWAYRNYHSTETAVVKIHNDLVGRVDRSCGCYCPNWPFVSLVDHLTCSKASTSVVQFIPRGPGSNCPVGGQPSSITALSCGVPQRSVLGPKMLIAYTEDIDIFARHALQHHSYAGDTQTYTSLLCRRKCSPSHRGCSTVSPMSPAGAAHDDCSWMPSKPNLCGSVHHHHHFTICHSRTELLSSSLTFCSQSSQCAILASTLTISSACRPMWPR